MSRRITSEELKRLAEIFQAPQEWNEEDYEEFLLDGYPPPWAKDYAWYDECNEFHCVHGKKYCSCFDENLKWYEYQEEQKWFHKSQPESWEKYLKRTKYQ